MLHEQQAQVLLVYHCTHGEDPSAWHVAVVKISLNKINAGTNAVIEVLVKEKRDENFDLSLLNMSSKLTLQGIYKDSSEKDRKIDSSKNINLILTSDSSQENISNDLKVITNKILRVNGEDKRVIQLSLDLGMNNNNFPMKEIIAEVDVPDIDGKQPEIQKIVNMNSMTSYDYNYSDKKVTISMTNKDNDNKVIWKKSGKEEIILTFLYDAKSKVEGINFNSDSKVRLYDDKVIDANRVTVSLEEEKEAIITGEISNPESIIYKGKLYNSIDRNFITNSTININLANVVEYLNIKETDLLYSGANDKEYSINTVITQTTINKQELLNIIGEEGTATITNLEGVVLATINKDTESDENGNIVINYNEEQTGIIINTTAIVAIGKLHIANNKIIKQNDKGLLKQVTELRTTIEGINNINSQEGNTVLEVSKTELKDSITESTLAISRNELSTVTENNNVDITAVLKSNSEKYDLYKNPKIEIEFPEDIKDVNVNSINKLYGDEFDISILKGVKDSKIVLDINLAGEETEYKSSGIEGTTIVINADLKLDNRATSKTDNFKMTYTNENTNGYEDGKPQGEEIKEVSIVSPKGLITTNNIEELGIQTIGEENTVNKTLEKGVQAKNITVKSEIINNDDAPISDVNILGNFGTDGKVQVNGEEKENNLGLTLKSNLNVEGIDASRVEVYYSENENATADITEESNAWKSSIDDAQKTKKYLVKVSGMEKTEGLSVSYNAEIPGQLQYNKQDYTGYTATYTNSQTQTSGKVNSTTIGLETGRGPVAEATLKASVGETILNDNDEVKQGEIIRYSVELKNTGSEDIVNGAIIAQIPEEVELLEKGEENSYVTTDKKELTINIDLLKVGESTTKTYEVKVKKDAEIGSTFKASTKLTYGEANTTTNEVTLKVARGELSVKLVPQIEETSVVGEDFSVEAIIENLTGQELRNVDIQWNISDNYRFVKQGYELIDNDTVIDENEYEENFIKVSEDKHMTIDSIPTNKTIYVYGHLVANDINSTTINDKVTVDLVSGNQKYTSNVMDTTIIGRANYDISMSANNEAGYVKAGEEINYTIQVKNNNKLDGYGIYLEDEIPTSLDIKEVTIDGEQKEFDETSNLLGIDLDIAKDTIKTINLKTVVNYNEGATEDETVVNKAKLIIDENNEITSNEITHKIQQEEFAPDGTQIYKVSGLAWVDQNSDGERQDSDNTLSGIKVKLYNTKTNQIAKDYNNEEIASTTNDSGEYTLSKIPEGNYIVVFEYDTAQYIVAEYQKANVEESRNSNVISKAMNIDGQEKTYAVTDNINIKDSNVSNINIGLIKSQGFDLSLDKSVSKIIVQNASGTSTYEYNNAQLAKVELDSKKIANSNVIVEYTIKVNNIGEVAGYAKNIVDYAPNDLKFSSELNKDWYQTGNNLYCKALENEKINVGESKTVKLVLTKAMTENNTGRINNIAEIAESYNDAGTPDINSIPGNKQQGENDMSSADVIISVKTGEVAMYMALVISMLAILGAGIYFIEKKIISRRHTI